MTMTTHIIVYTLMLTDTPGTISMDATDAQAQAKLRNLVRDGYRNETSARVTLLDGRNYGCSNSHGNIVCRFEG